MKNKPLIIAIVFFCFFNNYINAEGIHYLTEGTQFAGVSPIKVSSMLRFRVLGVTHNTFYTILQEKNANGDYHPIAMTHQSPQSVVSVFSENIVNHDKIVKAVEGYPWQIYDLHNYFVRYYYIPQGRFNENIVFKAIIFFESGELKEYNLTINVKGPKPVYNLTASNETHCSKVFLNWAAGDRSQFGNANVSHFHRIYRNNRHIATVPVEQTSYTDEPGTKDEYTYKVETWSKYDGLGTHWLRSASTEVKGKIWQGELDPGYISEVSTDECGQIRIEWSQPNPIDVEVFLYRNGSKVFRDGEVVNLYNTTIPYVDRNLAPGNYDYKILVEDGCASHFSNQRTGESRGTGIAPDNLEVYDTSENITLKWDAITDPYPDTEYKLVRSIAGQSGETKYQLNLATLADGSYTDTETLLCTKYIYRIEAENDCGTVRSNQVEALASEDLNEVIADLKISKGYFPDKVLLEWDSDWTKMDNIYINRSVAGEDSYTLIKTISDENNFEDNSAIGGVMYDYRIHGSALCDLELIETPELRDLGFYQPFGVANGHISYTGGNRVEGAKVIFESENESLGRSLLFNGTNYIEIPDAKNLNPQKNITIESWIKRNDNRNGKIISKNSYGINFQNNNIIFYIEGKNSGLTEIAIPYPETAGFVHVSGTFDGDSLRLYLNGNLAKSKFLNDSIALTNDILIIGEGFVGNIDEIRLWNISASPANVKLNSSRYLNGNEPGLVAYWRCNEPIGDYIFDASKTGLNYNKNDGKMQAASGNFRSADIPTRDQLGVIAVTNANGNYTARYIPFSFGGEVFTVTPMLGAHQFDPSSRTIYISSQSSTHNGLDFEDISSFNVEGTVLYSNTDYPVKDVYIKIDGNYVQGLNNRPVKTDVNGKYKISVPIGAHYISVEKTGHVFENDGIFPKQNPASGEIEKYVFMEDMRGLNFSDNTTVKLIGKVVGGPLEAAKTTGSKLNPSINNIGEIELTFQTSLEYARAVEPNPSDLTVISIANDSETGYYEVNLLPERYELKNIGGVVFETNSGYQFLFSDYGAEINMENVFAEKFVVDSIYADGKLVNVDTVLVYNEKRDYIWRQPPQMSVSPTERTGLFGDSLFIYKSQETIDTLKIASVNNDIANYEVMGRPVFSMGKKYDIHLAAFESYINSDGDSDMIDIVPVSDGVFQITNNCASPDIANVYLDVSEDGETTYSFFAGLPNLTKHSSDDNQSYINGITIQLLVEGLEKETWQQDAYVFGMRTTGNNFVTTGPDKIDFILRDPPGSNSFASLEQGSAIKTTSKSTIKSGAAGEETILALLGANVKTMAGLGFAVKLEIETDNNIGVKIEHKYTETNTTTTSYTHTFNETFSTSSSPDYVGSMADLFLGHSTNIVYGVSNNLQLVKETDTDPDNRGATTIAIDDKTYYVGIMRGMYVNPEFNTSFIYTQNHIEKYLIPNLIDLRNSFYYNNNSWYNLVETNTRSDKFLTNNDDDLIWGNDASEDPFNGPSYEFVIPEIDGELRLDADTVYYYNNQINIWKSHLAFNEEMKVEAERHPDFRENISFDAGAKYESSVELETIKGSSTEYNWLLNTSIVGELGFTINGMGAKMSFEETFIYEETEVDEDEITSTSKVSFTLEDQNQGNYFSVDVKDAKDAGGPVFYVRGGQSSCPFQGAELTKYYKPGMETLNQSTMQIEVPIIRNAGSSLITGVPVGTPAYYTVLLSNESESGDDVWYRLKADASLNNEAGARVTMDGAGIFDPGRDILIPAGKTIAKTIEVTQGRADVFEYDSLRIGLYSNCQHDPTDDIENIYSEIFVSTHFVPTCSNVEILQPKNQWVINSESNNRIFVTIGNYNLQHSTLNDFSLQYKRSTASEDQWRPLVILKQGYTGDSPDTLNIAGETVQYEWNVEALADGVYDLRVISRCLDGTVFESERSTGTINRIRPRRFGVPQPGDGILTANDNISIRFNETINQGMININRDINVRGMVNGTDLTSRKTLLHDVSVYTNGTGQNARIPHGVNLNNTSFTIEFWAKRSWSGKECIISQGDPGLGGLWIGFNEEDKFLAKIAGHTVKSNESYDAIVGQWAHYAVAFNIGENQSGKTVTLIIGSGLNETPVVETITNNYTTTGDLIAGYCKYDDTGFNGNIQYLRIWTEARSLAQTTAQRYQLLNGNERGLVGLWAMDEGYGDIIRDLASSRHGILDGNWTISRNNTALSFEGNGYAEFETGSMVFDDQTSFTIEFWFIAESQDACLISNGKADEENSLKPHTWSINTTFEGNIEVYNNGNKLFTSPSGYLDNNWHHLAMVVDRLGYTRLYLNGSLTNSIASTGLTGFAAHKAVLGAHFWTENNIEEHDSFLSGKIDEVRIWNTARTYVLINKNMNLSLSGNEPGLKAYFPFEDVNITDPFLSINTLSNMTNDEIGIAGPCVLVDIPGHVADAPPIKLPRPVESLPFDYVVNNDEMIITPNLEKAEIENQTLTISVQNITDMFGNRMASTETWTAYVNLNTLVWEKHSIIADKAPGEEKKLIVSLSNKGGTNEYFAITNLPTWLTASRYNGTIEPLKSMEIVFTVNPALNIGSHSADIYLSGNMGFNERLNIQVNVNAVPPDWQVTPEDFQYFMSVIGVLKINDRISTNVNDMIGAFVLDECRGIANVEYLSGVDAYIVFLNIYSNQSSGENIYFSIWDADNDKTYVEVTPDYIFQSNDIHGSPSNPVELIALNLFSNSVDLVDGWKWVSFNLSGDTFNSSDNLMSSVLNVTGDQIKGQHVFDTYSTEYGWKGSLTNSGGYDISQMYKVKHSKNEKLNYRGKLVNPDTIDITVRPGWNWIGYTPQHNMLLEEALSYHMPLEGDIIKNQYSFSMYDDLMGWFGNLKYMQPGLGYMYKSTDATEKIFNYPQKSVLKAGDHIATTSEGRFVHQWQETMNVIAELYVNNELQQNNYEISFYDNNLNFRGNAVPLYNYNNDKWQWFISIPGNRNEILQAEIFNLLTKEKYIKEELFAFEANTNIGSIKNPLKISVNMDEKLIYNESVNFSTITPNPFNNTININICDELRLLSIKVVSIEGRVLQSYNRGSNFNKSQLEYYLISLSPGIYFVKILHIEGIDVHRVVKQ